MKFITWTPAKLAILRKAQAVAADQDASYFVIPAGQVGETEYEFDTGYAKYLIEFLEGRLG